MDRFRAADARSQNRAADNHGIITFDEAIAEGHTPKSIGTRVRSGEWIRTLPRTFRMAAHPDTWESKLMAAIRWGGGKALASHASAAALYRLEGYGPGPIEISKPDSRAHRLVTCHRLSRENECRVRLVAGFPTTRLERTLLDLAANSPPKLLGRAIDDALRRRITTLARLRDELKGQARSGRRGIRRFRMLLDSRDGNDEALRSRFEARMLSLLRNIGNPALRSNVRVPAQDCNFYLDFAYPRYMLGIECHSAKYHLGDNWRKDFERDRILTALRWRILYFDWHELCFEPERVRREIEQAIHTHPDSRP